MVLELLKIIFVLDDGVCDSVDSAKCFCYFICHFLVHCILDLSKALFNVTGKLCDSLVDHGLHLAHAVFEHLDEIVFLGDCVLLLGDLGLVLLLSVHFLVLLDVMMKPASTTSKPLTIWTIAADMREALARSSLPCSHSFC